MLRPQDELYHNLSNVILRLQRHLSHAKPLTGQTQRIFEGKKWRKMKRFLVTGLLLVTLFGGANEQNVRMNVFV